MLKEYPGAEVIGEAETGREAVRLCGEVSPDVIIMDVAMPDLNGIEATRQILAERPETKVICLSMHSRRSLVIEMLKAGASGYLLKNSAFKELAAALSCIRAGKPYISPDISSAVLEGLSAPSSDTAPAATRLTPREREVVQLLAEGKQSKTIAAQLNISVKTVQTHRRNIMRKLGFNNLPDLTKYAVREGIVSLDL